MKGCLYSIVVRRQVFLLLIRKCVTCGWQHAMLRMGGAQQECSLQRDQQTRTKIPRSHKRMSHRKFGIHHEDTNPKLQISAMLRLATTLATARAAPPTLAVVSASTAAGRLARNAHTCGFFFFFFPPLWWVGCCWDIVRGFALTAAQSIS